MKKFFWGVLAVVLMVGIFPTTVLADTDDVSKGIVGESTILTQSGNVIQWGYDKAAGNADNFRAPRVILKGVAEIAGSHYIMKNRDYVATIAYKEDSTEAEIKPTVIFKDVKSAPLYNYVIKTDGSLWQFYGSLHISADGKVGHKPDNVPKKLMDGVADAVRNFALKTDGSVWQISPAKKIMDNVKEIGTGGSDANFALKKDGTLWSWGQNHNGMLGIGSDDFYLRTEKPAQIMSNVKTFNAVGRVYAIKNDDTLWGWGPNHGLDLYGTTVYGLGDGSTVKVRNKPVKIMDGVKSVSAQHSLAIRTDGSLWSWWPAFPGNGKTYNTSRKPIKIMDNVAAAHNNLAVKTDGSVWSWGQNCDDTVYTMYGQTHHTYYNGILGTGSKEKYILTPERVQGVKVK